MAADPTISSLPAPFTLRSAALTLVAVVLTTGDAEELAQRLAVRPVGPRLDQEPVALDLSRLRARAAPIDFPAVIALLQRNGMRPIAVRGGSGEQLAAAREAGLVEVPESVAAAFERGPYEGREAEADALAAAAGAEGVAAAPAAGPVAVGASSAPAAPVPERRTLVIDKPLRSGQQVYARGRDVVVLAAVNHGAEVIADGHVHVYAPLRGRAIAGARGDADARIFSTCMEPQLVAIAGTYRTTESAWPATVWARPALVRLAGDRIVVEPIEA